MSRIHDERKDVFSREGVLTSTTNIRSIHSLSQTMEKEKTEKSGFNQHGYDSGFRTIDLIKPPVKPSQLRNIVPSSLGSSQLHSMPPLMPNYITGSGHLINPVPINHSSLVRSSLSTIQHAFQAHVPMNIGASKASMVSPQGNVTISQRTSLPSLKPTNVSSQILPINQISGLPTILPPAVGTRAGPLNVTSHGLSSDSRLDARTTLLSEPHHNLRGNVQASNQHGGQATIQVLSSGTAAQQSHVPASFLSKGMALNAAPNMLKIGVSTHSNISTAGAMVPAFKLGIGKPFPGSSSVIIPVTGTGIKSDNQDVRHHAATRLTYSKFSASHSVTLPSHLIQSHSSTTATTTTTSLTSASTAAIETRTHTSVGVPFHPISGAYVFHDIAPIGLHNFSHQLIRPPATTVGSLPMFTIDSHRTLSTVPVVSIATSNKANVSASESLDTSRSESLTIHGNATFNISNIYPNLQQSNFAAFSSTSNAIDSSTRPSILRKRPAETSTLFPVQPTEKERITSPLRIDSNSPASILQSKMISPPTYKNHEKLNDVTQKSINHSIFSITSDAMENTGGEQVIFSDNSMLRDASIAAQQSLLTSAMTAALNTNNNLSEASPKKKPRKQPIITTEDKYGNAVPINSVHSTGPQAAVGIAPAELFSTPATTNTIDEDEDEEFLKSNETMKDMTPPKVVISPQTKYQKPHLALTSSHSNAKKLFLPVTSRDSSLPKAFVEVKKEPKNIILNGLVSPPLPEKKNAEAVKYIFHRRPQISILNEYKVNPKAAHNHFYRYSDVRIKEDKKTSNDRMMTKSSVEAVSGWRIQHLSTQLDDMMSLEREICEEMLQCKDTVPLPSLYSPDLFEDDPDLLSQEETQLCSLHELLQGSIQRCRYSIEQLDETKQLMLKMLEHKPKALDLIKKYKKPRLKKKLT